ncbi:hypothetical protein [Carboxylicivirga sp. RSCT41]|uniref:hypothetical protein n=1 Tax=Carboxylicivirga agarovorans TaxID=3417570 RepID=UPI003D344185
MRNYHDMVCIHIKIWYAGISGRVIFNTCDESPSMPVLKEQVGIEVGQLLLRPKKVSIVVRAVTEL